MAFARPTLADLVTRIGADLASRLGINGAPLRRSVAGILARVMAAAAHGLYGYLDWLSRQVLPDQAEAEFLARHASVYGITRNPAGYASGNVTFTGSNGSSIPSGTVVQRQDGTTFATDAGATISGGTATVAVTAEAPGAAGNTEAGASLSLVSPIAGVQSGATVAAGGIADGVDVETDEALRSRLLARIQQPPAGGAAHDYIAWAREVPGVTRAWVYPGELGPGTVTVRFVLDGQADIIPGSGKVEEVQDYIDERRPVTADVTVVAPIPVELDFEISIAPDTAAVRAAVEEELRDLLARDAVPGGTILLSRIREAVSVAAGESDNEVIDPSTNVTHTTGQLAVMGEITWA